MENTYGVFIFDSTGKMLICRPYGVKGNSGWSIPKGKAEPNESRKDAAIRETLEETGLDISSYKDKLEYIGEKKYKSRKKRLHAFILLYDKKINVNKLICDPKLNGKSVPEIDKYEMVWADDALKRIHDTQATLLEIYLEGKRYAE